MSTFAPTVLSPGQREKLIADPDLGGGSIIRTALAHASAPDVAFINLPAPILGTDGQPLQQLSLRQLDELVQSWSMWYVARGVQPRDRVAVYLPDSFAYHVHFYALAQIGAIAVLINSNSPGSVATELCRQTTPVGLYVDRERLARISDSLDSLGIRWIDVAEEVPAPPADVLTNDRRFLHAPDDPVCLLHSSGTTGRPKPTIHTHKSIVAGPRFRMLDHVEVPGALMMTALPQSHLGCIAYTTYAVLAGTPIVPLRDAPGGALLDAIATYRPTTMMSFAHGYTELASAPIPPGALDSIDVWITIGDAIHETHITTLLSERSPHLKPAMFLDRLGTTELGWGVLLQTRTLQTPAAPRCAGRPVGVAEVTILRRDGSIADDNEIGLLAANGPAITPGYWNDSETTYRSKLSGYWLTGDFAYRDDDGRYYLVDRVVDAIDTPEGVAHSVLLEELLLARLAGISDCTVVAGTHGGSRYPIAVVKAAHASSAAAETLLRMANDVLRAEGYPRLAALQVAENDDDLPVGVTGKVLKRQLRARFDDFTVFGAESDRWAVRDDVR